jgi:hypothetical protein
MTFKTRHLFFVSLLACYSALGVMESGAAVPQVLNHQGRVAVNGVNFQGNGQFKFALVNANGSATYWSNDGTSSAGSQPTSAVTLAVNKGLYSVLLGDTTLANMAALSSSALDHEQVRLRIWFNDGSRNFQQLTPDQRLAAAPFALLAAKSTVATAFEGPLAGDVTGTQAATSIAAETVTGKPLTGYLSVAGTLSASDSILSAINKLNGNDALKANSDSPTIASPTFTGTVGGLTKSMVGLGNVDNTSDADKPVSTAQLAALAEKADTTALDAKAPLASPTFTGTVGGLSKSMVGLGNVDNISDANKPVSTAQQSALDLKAPLASPAFTGTVSGITASMVGLANVTNTSDANKPVSTAQKTALDLKAPLASPTFTGTVLLPTGTASAAPLRLAAGISLTTPVFGSVEFDGTNLLLTNNAGTPTRKTLAFTDAPTFTGVPLAPTASSGTNTGQIATTQFVQSAIQGVVGAAPAALDTLNELAVALNDDASYASTITTALSLKAPLASPTFTGIVSGSFSGLLEGNATTATTATDFSGSLIGDVSGTQSATVISAATVTGKVLTNYASASGTILATDTILSAINKLNGNNALKANAASPTFTGTVRLPTGTASAAPLRLATGVSLTTPAFGSVEFDGTNLFLTNNAGSPTRKTLAFTDAPTFTGVPVAPTADSGTNTGQIATTQFVQSAIQGVVGAAPAALDTLNELAEALNDDASYASTITTALSLKAPLASPTFTGTVSGITASMVGLGSVSNTSDANKPVSTAQQSALDLKAPLASPTFTGIVSGSFSGLLDGNATTATTATDFSGSLIGDVTGTQSATVISAATVTGKPLTGYLSGEGTLSASDSILSAINKLNGNDNLKANLASPTFTGTVGGLTKSMVGLGNVDNTADLSKPVSASQQAALDLKAPLTSPGFTGTVTLPAGGTTAAPLRLTAGTNLTAATLGAVEFDGNNLYLTTNAASPTRKTVALSETGSSSQIGLSSVFAAPLNPVVAWGNNSEGQTLPPVVANVAAVAAGDLHSIALLDDGQVVEWGKSVVGGVSKPTLTGVTDIAAGGSHNLVRQSNGRVLAWGDNTDGQATAPTDIVTAVKVAAGSRHSLALLANGTVRGWGESYLGKNAAPASLTGMTVIAIAAGQNHSLALKNTGEVVAWGSNEALQTAVPAGALSGITAIAAGWNHNLALKSDGSVIAWGLNNGGQTDVPTAASSGVVQVAAGDTYSMALKADGTIITWGFKAVENPVTVVPDGTTQVTQIAAGGYHALALRADSVPAQLARLDSVGRLGIGRIPVLNALEVDGDASKSTAGSWLANSDRRIKTEIESITGALDKLNQVRLVDFRYTDDYLAAHPGIEDRRYPNVIAQEFQKVFPDDVKGSGETLPDGSEILQVDTYPLTIYSAAAVQELHRENLQLKQKLAEQDRKLAGQEQRLRKLELALTGK